METVTLTLTHDECDRLRTALAMAEDVLHARIRWEPMNARDWREESRECSALRAKVTAAQKEGA